MALQLKEWGRDIQGAASTGKEISSLLPDFFLLIDLRCRVNMYASTWICTKQNESSDQVIERMVEKLSTVTSRSIIPEDVAI